MKILFRFFWSIGILALMALSVVCGAYAMFGPDIAIECSMVGVEAIFPPPDSVQVAMATEGLCLLFALVAWVGGALCPRLR